ncbi:MAG: D-alanyl-D-alanine carboxypeptidase family protein, partial [Oscillospiraceae bacterium]
MRIVRAVTALLLAAMLTLSAAAGGGEWTESTREIDGLPAAALVNTKIPCKSAILIEQSTGRVLFEKEADLAMPPASITKIMTLLLIVEALDAGKIALDDPVTCSPHASSMGGTQIWFEVGERMTVEELLKATAIASANDASVALGELLCGSEEAFVARMNERAAELGMTHTVFQNATGLDAQGHQSTARDIALMSAELLRHPRITQYTTIWMDS